MRLAMLSGGVGGARLARGLAALTDVDLTVIVNVGDDERVYGLSVSPDIDTVIYTMAGREGPHGWGLRKDSFTVMGAMDPLPIDTTFRIGDRDIATNLFRTDRLTGGWSLTWVTTALASAFGVPATVLPATDDPLRSQLKVAGGDWISFQDYFVVRGHTDEVEDIRFEGAGFCRPAPGVIEAIEASDALIIGPSNPDPVDLADSGRPRDCPSRVPEEASDGRQPADWRIGIERPCPPDPGQPWLWDRYCGSHCGLRRSSHGHSHRQHRRR